MVRETWLLWGTYQFNATLTWKKVTDFGEQQWMKIIGLKVGTGIKAILALKFLRRCTHQLYQVLLPFSAKSDLAPWVKNANFNVNTPKIAKNSKKWAQKRGT